MRKFRIRWTTSKAKKTPGHAICSLWENGKKLYSCKGTGGYDMEGTVVARWLLNNYRSRIEKLYSPNFYGGITAGCQKLPDGRCGLSSMRSVADAIGLEISEHRFGELIAFFITDRKGGSK